MTTTQITGTYDATSICCNRCNQGTTCGFGAQRPVGFSGARRDDKGMPEMTCLADGKNGACGWFNGWSMGDYIEFVYAAMLRAQRRSVGLRCHSLAHGGCGYERKRERSFVRNRQAPTDRPGRAPPSPPLLFCFAQLRQAVRHRRDPDGHATRLRDRPLRHVRTRTHACTPALRCTLSSTRSRAARLRWWWWWWRGQVRRV